MTEKALLVKKPRNGRSGGIEIAIAHQQRAARTAFPAAAGSVITALQPVHPAPGLFGKALGGSWIDRFQTEEYIVEIHEKGSPNPARAGRHHDNLNPIEIRYPIATGANPSFKCKILFR